MPWFDIRLHAMARAAYVVEVHADGREEELSRVVAVNTMEGWVEEHRPISDTVEPFIVRRRGKFVVRHSKTGAQWPD